MRFWSESFEFGCRGCGGQGLEKEMELQNWKKEIGKSFCGMSYEGLSNHTPDHMSVMFY